MKRIYSTLFLLPVFLLVTSSVNAESAMEWVQKMSQSMRNLSYRGYFVYMHENQLEGMSIFHIKDEHGEKERLFSLNGEAREVIRDNKNLTCIWPSSRMMVVDSARQNTFSPLFVPDDIAAIKEHYDMKLLGRDRVADRETMIVHILPKDHFRYGIQLWLDVQHGLLIKSKLINEKNEVVEQVMFTKIELLSPAEQHMLQAGTVSQLDESFSLVRSHRGDVVDVGKSDLGWKVSNVPAGFIQESVVMRQQKSGEGGYQMIYSDGLASLSVFIDTLSEESLDGGTSMGAVNAFMRVLDNYSVTVIGEVPAITVRQVAESIYYKKP